MKKIVSASLALFFIIAGFLVFIKNKKSVQPDSSQKSIHALPSNFEATTHFKMVSRGTFLGNQDGGLKIHTDLEGSPVISFDKDSRVLKMVWTPLMVLKVNDVLNEGYKSDLESVKDETFYAHFNEQMVMDKIYYSKRANVQPAVQELVLNFNKMLAHQAAWYLTSIPMEKTTYKKGVDIWGETEITLTNDGTTTLARLQSIEKKSIQNGTGKFEITKDTDGKVFVEGSQEASMGDGDSSKSMATTLNEYSFTTLGFKHTKEIKISVDFSKLDSTPPWMVVDSKAIKEDSLKEKLKSWDKNKLQKAVFNFKLPANSTYKDVGEISGIISDMLYMDHSLAKAYYEWVKKLGPEHPLYPEIIKALGVVGCPECQVSLLKITEDYRNNVNATEKSLVAIGFVENPEVATEERMREFAQDRQFKNSGMANAMLGNYASALAEKDPERAKKIDEELSNKLNKSKNKNDIQRQLAALGNSGQCTDYNAIAALTKNTDIDIRKDAVMALRYCKNEQVDELYKTLFREKGEMRMSVVQAVEMRISTGINLEQQFDFFAKWIENPASTLDQQETGMVVNLLRAFSRQERRYMELFNVIKKNCSNNNTCAYFK